MTDRKLSLGVGIPPRPPISLFEDVVARATEAGVSTLWCIDHFSSFIPHSVWDEDFTPFAGPGSSPDEILEYQAVLGYAAARAPQLGLGVGVTEAFRRHPLVLAHTFLTLSHLTASPVILGIGAGERENVEPAGFAFDRPVSRLEEALAVIRLAFESRGPIDYRGQHFRLDGAVLDLGPGPAGRPQIWVAALGPRMLRLTGELADGWYPTGITEPTDYAQRLATIRAAAEDAGRDPGDVTPGLQVFAVTGTSREEARERLDADPVRLMSLLLPAYEWAKLGATHPLGTDFGGLIDFVPQHLDEATARSALAAVPDAVLEATVLWGTPDDVVSAASDLADAGLGHLVVHDVPALPGPPPGSPTSRFEVLKQIGAALG